MNKNKISDFLSPDISYLLGLITGRGEIHISNEVKRIVIDFKYKTLEAEAITQKFNQKLHIQTSLDNVVNRLKILGIETLKNVTQKNISIILKWHHEDISWQFINFLINGSRFSYHDFLIPEAIFNTNNINKLEFLRGLADVTAYMRNSNSNQAGRHRVYIEISNKNWYLPVQICKLMQSQGIPITNLNFGHPNLRDPKASSQSTGWAKEHQIKIYADDFEKTGFYISHKSEALKELSEYNKANFKNTHKLCEGITRRAGKKAIHPHENHKKLPPELSGKHFDAFREICKCLGCYLQKD